ncbi:MAG: xanthine dehydrogenase family protein subunit M [Chloroflexi bacterium]|nr:xanthine dehydrogenase family protein subunit M [Chloroflexota bacterium]
MLAGGHSLLPALKLRATALPALVDIGRIPGLAGVEIAGQALKIGALTTHAAVAESDAVRQHCPLLAETAAQIGDRQVRNRGTIGGSLAHADPAADYPTVILAMGATLTATGAGGAREIHARDFFTDLLTTALGPDEVLTSVSMPAYGTVPGMAGVYLKHRHPASSYAVVGVAAVVHLQEGKFAHASVTVGGATVNPVHAAAAQAALIGQPADEATISAAAGKVAEAISNPLSDVYASGEYRTHLAGVLARRALMQAVARAMG